MVAFFAGMMMTPTRMHGIVLTMGMARPFLYRKRLEKN